MLELEDARQRLLAAIKPLPAEPVPLARAAGRVLAEDVFSPIDLPPFDNSAMDGYAVRSADVTSASLSSPVTLDLMGQVAAGEVSGGTVQPGCCVRVFTGSMLPPGNAFMFTMNWNPAYSYSTIDDRLSFGCWNTC